MKTKKKVPFLVEESRIGRLKRQKEWCSDAPTQQPWFRTLFPLVSVNKQTKHQSRGAASPPEVLHSLRIPSATMIVSTLIKCVW